jgi:hypothetical protein
MTTIQRTGKPLKALQAVGYVALYGGATAYLFADSDAGLIGALVGAAIVGLSRILIWWFHR